VNAEQRGLCRHPLFRQWLARLCEIDVSRQFGKADGVPDLTGFIEKRIAKRHVAKAAAKAFGLRTFGVGITTSHALHALASYIGRNLRLHLDEYETARICFLRRRIHFQHGMARGSASREAIQHEVAWVRRNLQDTFNHPCGLRCEKIERRLRSKNFTQFLLDGWRISQGVH